MFISRKILCSYSKLITSRPLAWCVQELCDDGSFRYIITERKSYNYNALFFNSLLEAEHYANSKGWI